MQIFAGVPCFKPSPRSANSSGKASIFAAVVGIAVTVVRLSMALLFFRRVVSLR